jgi:multiple antibiotic resistance protein
VLIWKSFLLAFTALLPLINPLGSAIIFLGLAGTQSLAGIRLLSRKVALSTLGFLVFIEFLGSLLLSFFGISLPIVQVTGGIVIAATAWSILFEKDADADSRNKQKEADGCSSALNEELSGKVFYPLTFPITAGPGTLVVMLTLSAHVSGNNVGERIAAYGGIALASAALSGAVYVCYAYSPKLTSSVSASTVHGVLRVVAFILMCIGVQIAWNGLSLLGMSLLAHR